MRSTNLSVIVSLLIAGPYCFAPSPLQGETGTRSTKDPGAITKQRSTGAQTAAAPRVSKTPKPPAPRPTYITNWSTGKKLIALTYDDGPDPKYTPKLMALLKAKQVPATFYVLGQRVQEYPAITKQLHDEGFEVVNHTFDHKQLTTLSGEKVRWELSATNDLITAITGKPVTHMRPPYGSRNAAVDAIIKEMGMKSILWDIDTQDWKKRSSAHMANLILKSATDGSIVLFHDRYQSSIDATEAVIDELRARGYTFVTVGEMLSQPQAQFSRNAAKVTTSTVTVPSN